MRPLQNQTKKQERHRKKRKKEKGTTRNRAEISRGIMGIKEAGIKERQNTWDGGKGQDSRMKNQTK